MSGAYRMSAAVKIKGRFYSSAEKFVEQILINSSREEARVAILEDGILKDILVERMCARGLVGNVYYGQVVRVLPGMQSAFLNVGLERTAFLHIAEIEGARTETGALRPIETLLHEGQRLMVQVAKDPIGTKGARLTTTISLAGRKLVYLPNDTHIGVSQRIDDEALRERLREEVTALRPPEEKGGYIVRTSAEEGATEEEFRTDMTYLAHLWKEIQQKAREAKGPKLLYQDLTLSQRVLRDLVHEETASIEVDERGEYKALQAFARQFVPTAAEKLHFYEGETPLFELYGIDAELEKALGRRVDLKSGGYLVFDQTEAMTTIDVNTGAYVGKRDFSDTVFKTNLEAAQVIARQLRLRNLGGIIIVDFIDMEKESQKEELLAYMRGQVKHDRTKTNIVDITSPGLVEITRKKTRQNIDSIVYSECPICHGRGRIESPETVAIRISRDIRRMERKSHAREGYEIEVHETVAEELQANQLMMNLAAEFGTDIKVTVKPGMHPENYTILQQS